MRRERFELNPSEDILLRVFCAARGDKIVLLLHGYDKGKDPSDKRQQTEIAEAKRRLKGLDTRERKARQAEAGRGGRR
jgi:phage-related protein